MCIKWCKGQNKGIKLTFPNERIGRDYLKESDIDFNDLKHNSLKWKNIMGYYACYNAFYGLLQRIGIKSEIHDCSIALLDLFPELSRYKRFINLLKKNRIDVQYYLKKPREIDIKRLHSFILDCKHLFNTISYDRIQEIRKEIAHY